MENKSSDIIEENQHQNPKKKLINISKFRLGYMKLQEKIFIIFSVVTIVMLCIGYLVIDNIFIDSFKEIERKATKKQIQQVINALEQDMSQLATMNKDYAAWDATYTFLKDKNSNYLKENLIDETFSINNWNVFILIDEEGKIVYKKGFDLINEKEISISSDLLQQIKSQSNLFLSSNIENIFTGIISIPQGHMMISSHPILTSDFEGPIRGWLIVGRYINSYLTEELSKRTQSIVVLEELGKQKIPYTGQLLQMSLIEKAEIWVENKNDEYISGYSLIYDVYEKPALLLRVDIVRDIYKQVDSSIHYFVIIILFMAGIYFLATWIFMKEFIFKRLKVLMSSVSEIGKNRDLSRRVSIIFDDELSILESEFNNMMATLEKSQKRIIHQSQHDDLTGLSNRSYFYNRVRQLLVQADDENAMAAILFIDVDNFKEINDLFGHEIGDIVLKGVAKILKNIIAKDVMSKDSIASRIGGDEFIILIPNIREKKTVEEISKKISKFIKQPFFINDKHIFIDSSIGISLYPFDGKDIDILISNADIAMYRAKKERDTSFIFYNENMRNRLTREKLQNALEGNELELYYQPQVNGTTGIIEGMEVLLRWENSELGKISPLEFIPLAEETGLIIAIGEWVLRSACIQNKKWQDAGYRSVRMAVNISSIQLMHPEFVSMVKRILEETILDGIYLGLEITESIALNKEKEIVEKLLSLQSMGIQICIDDFGTGYSSLSYLERLPINCLKIDKTFIKNIANNSTIPKMIIGMAQSLELSVIAEGVETKEELDYLRKFGCEYMQGYLFSKPLSAESFDKLLADEENMLDEMNISQVYSQ